MMKMKMTLAFLPSQECLCRAKQNYLACPHPAHHHHHHCHHHHCHHHHCHHHHCHHDHGHHHYSYQYFQYHRQIKFFFTNLTVVLAGIGTGQVTVHRPCVPDDVLKALEVRKMITIILLSSSSSSTCMLSSSSSSSWLTVLAKVSLSVNSSTKAASSSLLGWLTSDCIRTKETVTYLTPQVPRSRRQDLLGRLEHLPLGRLGTNSNCRACLSQSGEQNIRFCWSKNIREHFLTGCSLSVLAPSLLMFSLKRALRSNWASQRALMMRIRSASLALL